MGQEFIYKNNYQTISCPGHSRPVVQVCYSQSSGESLLCSAAKDGCQLREGQTGDWIGTFRGHKGAVWSCSLNHNATLLATAGADFSAKLWNCIDGEELATFTVQHVVRAIDLSKHGTLLVSGGLEKVVRIYDLLKDNPMEPTQEIEDLDNGIRCVNLAKNDTLVLFSFLNQKDIWVYDIKSSKVIKKLKTPSEVTSIEIDAQEGIVTSASQNQVQQWSLDTFDQLFTLDIKQNINAASFSSRYKQLCVGCESSTIRLYDTQTKEELQELHGHHGPVHTVAYSPNELSFSSGSEDGLIKIWQSSQENTQQKQNPAQYQYNLQSFKSLNSQIYNPKRNFLDSTGHENLSSDQSGESVEAALRGKNLHQNQYPRIRNTQTDYPSKNMFYNNTFDHVFTNNLTQFSKKFGTDFDSNKSLKNISDVSQLYSGNENINKLNLNSQPHADYTKNQDSFQQQEV